MVSRLRWLVVAPVAATVSLAVVLVLSSSCRRWNTPPDSPTRPIPDSGATDRDTGITLSWTGSDPDENDTLTYDVYLGTSANPPLVDSGLDKAAFHPGNLGFSTLYRWRVVAHDKHGYTTSSPIWVFRTILFNHSPERPHSPIPDSGAPDWPSRTKLYWSGGDADTGDRVTYDVYFGTTSPPPLVGEGRTDTSYAPGPLNYVTTYYWKVVAFDNHGATSEGSVWRFTTSANHPPNTPSYPTPGSGAQNQLLRLTLSWTGGDSDSWDVVRYDVYLGTGTTPPKIDSNRLLDSVGVGRLKYDSLYYWKVVARDDQTEIAEGPLWMFRTIAALRVTAPESLVRIRALSSYTITWQGGPSGLAGHRRRMVEPREVDRTRASARTLSVRAPFVQRQGRSPIAMGVVPPGSLRTEQDWSGDLPVADSTIISLSTDNGLSWRRQGRSSVPGRYDWIAPYAPAPDARVRVCSYVAGDTYQGVSGRFTVYDTLAPSAINVTSPTPGARWTAGDIRDVTWSGGTDGYDSAVVFYSSDSQRTWTRQGKTTVPGLLRAWYVPGPATSHAYVLVRAWCRSYSQVDTSDRFFVLAPPAPDTVVATVRVGSLPRALCWDSLDNRLYVANYGDSSVTVIDTLNHVSGTVRVPQLPLAMAWSRTSNKLYVACESNAVAVINCATNTVTRTIGAARPLAVCWNATGNKIYVANSRDSSVTVIDGNTDSVIARATVGSSPSALAWSVSANKVYVTNSASNSVSVIGGSSNALLWTEPVDNTPSSVVVDAIHNRVYVGNRVSSSVTVLDGTTNRAVTTITTSQEPWALAHNETQGQVYCAASAANAVDVIDTLHVVGHTIGVGLQPRSLVWAGITNRLYVANYGSLPGTVSLINCESYSVTKTLVVGNKPVAVCWNPISRRVYVANQDAGTVTVIGR